MSSTVALTIAGRTYEMACDDSQVATLETLGRDIDRRAQDLLRSVGHVSDSRLLVMVALTLADELGEARKGIAPSGDNGASDAAIAERLEALANRIEAIADRA